MTAKGDQGMGLQLVKFEAPQTKAEKATRAVNDIIAITAKILATWARPRFQREVQINKRVKAVALEIGNTKVIPGVLTLGVWQNITYIIDGQHRLKAFELADIDEAYAEVRILYVASLEEMAAEYLKLQSCLSKMRPDDALRAAEDTNQALKTIRSRCPFVGYDRIRRSPSAPLLSMSAVIRSWVMGAGDVPHASGGAKDMAETMTTVEAEHCSSFLNSCLKAWGRDEQYLKLWGLLNLALCAWLYRRIVLEPHRAMEKRTRLDGPTFTKCLMELSANAEYVSWLTGRLMGEAHRAPAYYRIKSLFLKRLRHELGTQATYLPAPEWAPKASRLKGITT